MDHYVRHLLSRVANRFRRLRFAWLLSVVWICLTVSVVAVAYRGFTPLIQDLLRDQQNLPYLAAGTFLGLTIVWMLCRLAYRDYSWLATQVENRYPSLKQRLITATQPSQEGESLYLRRSLIKETVHHGRIHDWKLAVSSSRMFVAWLFQFVTLFLAVGVLAVILVYPDMLPNSHGSVSLSSLPTPPVETQITVEPGNVEIERGSDVVITARFPAPVPEVAFVDTTDALGTTTRTDLQRSLSDPLFGGYLRSVQQDVSYAIDYAFGKSQSYKITVFDYPGLVRSDATIESPSYAHQERRLVKDTRTVSVVEGSTLSWSFQLNKPVVVAELIDKEGEVTVLQPSSADPLQYEVTFAMTESKRWILRLVDSDQRTSKFDEELSAKVLLNKPPETKLAKAQDLNLSPLQEVTLQAAATDDFGVHASGLIYALGDAEPVEIVFPSPVENESQADTLSIPPQDKLAASKKLAIKKIALAQTIELEKLQAEPDQLLSYYFWVEDIDRDGNVRRVDGDMFFADIRPYEEIFREGEAPSAQQSQQQQESSAGAEQAEKLAELQKQIISGTWNVLRKYSSKTKSIKPVNELESSLAEEVTVLSDSQKDAIAQTDELEEKIQDNKSLAFLKDVRESMNTAVQHLTETATNSDVNLLRDALKSERKAYEGLLRLRAREHEIVQSQQQQSSQSSQSASQRNRQQQIDQLKLDAEENRYETEQQAEAEDPAAERETRQVMNRLEELAKRQRDVNEQLKEIETALQEAKAKQDEEKEKELQEQLERLRENQEQLLRDSDELLDRMNQSESQQAMQEAREQMEQARSDIQQSVQSLAEGKAAPAISSGTRAERQMEETRDELRKQSANQLEQTVKGLLEKAKELEDQQQKLQEKLNRADGKEDESTELSNSQNESATPLRPEGVDESDSNNQDSENSQWKSQQERLSALHEQMQETVSEAETSEPLLAEELYDAFRNSKQTGIGTGMEQVPQLLERGLEEQAKQIGTKVADGVRELRERIEEATEKVVGSEQASLRLALSELDAAKKQIESEANRNDPASKSQSPSNSNGASDNPSGQEATGKEASEKKPSQEETAEQASKELGEQSESSQQLGSSQPGSSQQSGESQQRGESPQGNSPQQGESQQSSSQQGRTPANGQGRATGNQRGGGVGLEQIAGGGTEGPAPLTGKEFGEWTDALRDVEELVSDPEMKADAARIREAAREMRIDYSKHAKDPQWPMVRRLIVEPLDQLREKVQDALLRSSAERNAIVPVDRDPLPSNYQQQLDKYYENLGSEPSR